MSEIDLREKAVDSVVKDSGTLNVLNFGNKVENSVGYMVRSRSITVKQPDSDNLLIVGNGVSLEGGSIVADHIVVRGAISNVSEINAKSIRVESGGCINMSDDAAISVEIADVLGSIEGGHFNVSNVLKISDGGIIKAHVKYSKLSMEEGAVLSGNIEVLHH